MGLKLLRFLSLYLTAVAAGVVFSHVMEIAPKAQLSPAVYLDVQQVLLRDFGPILGVVEGGALLSTLGVLFMLRGSRLVFWLTLTGFLCLALMILIWALWINPLNAQIETWTAETLPLRWHELRDDWAFFHRVRAFCAAIGLGALLVALLAETPGTTRAARISLPLGSFDRSSGV